jgi:hypothetical protein
VLAGCPSESPPAAEELIARAIGVSADFSAVSKLERVAQGEQIILHRPDTGYRRLTSDPPLAAVAAGDGAEPLMPEEAEPGFIPFALGADCYCILRAMLGSLAR